MLALPIYNFAVHTQTGQYSLRVCGMQITTSPSPKSQTPVLHTLAICHALVMLCQRLFDSVPLELGRMALVFLALFPRVFNTRH